MRSVPGWGVFTSAAAPVLLIGGWTLAARLQPGHFDSVTDTISDLAAIDAPHRWVMSAALIGVGAAHIGTALALRPAAPAGRWLLATGGVATVLVAANPLPAGGGPAPEHAIAAGVAFVALAAWPTLSWRRDHSHNAHDSRKVAETREPVKTTGNRENTGNREPEDFPIPFRPTVALAAGGALLGGLGWFFAEFLQDGDRVGLSERVAAGSQALWPLAAVLLTRRTRHIRRAEHTR
ncbi:MAG TPA: DUF998 domain-containing protein [Kineosporiaceae bacterium]|nr:DUF998 domain-containing protein [Kineosporiaceae bacterium]